MAELEESEVMTIDEQMYFLNVTESHESAFITTAIKCYTCMDDGIIIVDFAPGIGIAGEQNCPDCGDGERVDA